MSEKKTFLQH